MFQLTFALQENYVNTIPIEIEWDKLDPAVC